MRYLAGVRNLSTLVGCLSLLYTLSYLLHEVFVMSMSNTQPPVNPGAYLREHVEAIKYPKKRLASLLGISRPGLYAIFENRLRISVDMAVKLEALFGRPALEWLEIQNAYDIWMARQEEGLDELVSSLENLRREIRVDECLRQHQFRQAS